MPVLFHVAVCLSGVTVVANRLAAADRKPTEYQVEAAYLFNFGKFVDWPPTSLPNTEAPLVVCVLGEDPFGSSLDSILQRGTVKGKAITAKRIGRVEEVASCQVLYISASEAGSVDRILNGVGKISVLTVSDMPQFLDRGGMIQFVLEEGKIRFQINLNAAENARLVLSSELLKVAMTVKRK
ncbi:MAG TPA: YfiR family protein [Terriglobales bacterium]|jgi:hypothetical protein|nr:YfiR family protein [Terriglobales bacterium]